MTARVSRADTTVSAHSGDVRQSGARVWIAFALLSLFWGSSYLFIRIGVEQLSPLALVSLRLLIGALGLAALNLLRHTDLRVSAAIFRHILVLATINTAVPFLLISWGEQTVPSGLASVLNSTVPIFAVLIAGVVLHDEPITRHRTGGVALGFAGIIVLMSRDLGNGLHWGGLAAQLAIILASLLYAIGAVYARRNLRDVAPMTMATYNVAIAATETTILSLLFSRPPLHLHPGSLLAVLWLGLLGTAFAYVLSFFVLRSWGAARYTLVAYMLPLTGLVLGVIVLHEAMTWRIIAGSILVLSGVVLAGRASPRRPAAPPARDI